MSLFFGMPVLVKMGVSLGLILVIHKLSRSLLTGIILGTTLLAFWAGHSLESALQVAGTSFLTVDSFMLLAVIVLVIILSNQMSVSGMMKELVGAVQARINRRASVAVLPALIGLLPMPGGALFSAPLVDDCDTDRVITPLLKTRANYWFRHIWEFWWPIYPGALLAIELSGIHVWQYIIVMFPLTIFAILAGYLFILRQIPRSHAHGTGTIKLPILPLVFPIVIVLLTYIAVQLFLPVSEEVSTYLPMLYGLVLAVLYVQVRRPLGPTQWRKMIFSRRLFDMVAIVAVIKIYGAFVEAPVPDGTVMIDLLRSELDTAGIPAVLLIVLLPFVSAVTTGLSVGFVGTSFPVVLSLLGPDPTVLQLMQVMPFAYGIGHMGMMLSPVHVCLVVTNSHFKTGLGASLTGMLKPVLFTAAGICIVGGAWQLL